VAGGLGLLTGFAGSIGLPWQLATMLGWIVAAASVVAWIWLTVWNVAGDDVHAIATREDDSRAAARSVVLGASLISLSGVVLGLLKANELDGWWKAALTVAAITTVIASWFAVHTMFAMRYAHLFYSDSVGGLTFADEPQPDFRDFGYVAFTVGMTFQVSDTEVSSRLIRRTITRHALLSYLFGTVIVALLINVTAGLIR
jgi:uncharacterized membrane protein